MPYKYGKRTREVLGAILFPFSVSGFLLNFCIEDKIQKVAGNFVTYPSRGVWGGAAHTSTGLQGQSPGGGPGDEAPRGYWVFSDSKCLLTCLVAHFFISQQIIAIV